MERRLEASKNDFPGRLRQWSKLSGRTVPDAVSRKLEATRSIRHEIVHRGRRIANAERGVAQRAVDTSRWAFNFIEGRRDLAELRETRLALRSIGRFNPGMHFLAELTPDGVVVTVESFDDADDPEDAHRENG